MKASNLIGSQVLELCSASVCGIVCNVIPSKDGKRIKALSVFTTDEDDCEKKYLEVKRISSVSEVVTVMNTRSLVMCYEELPSPINCIAYGENGELYGTVTDLELDEKLVIKSIFVGEKEFAPSCVLSRSGDIMIFRKPGSKTRIVRRSVKFPTVKRVSTQTDAPVKIMGKNSYAFLVGKSISKDVCAPDGLPVAVKGEKVTSNIISLAKQKGAIVKLTMAAL